MKKLFFVAVIMMASISAFAQHAPGTLTLQPRIGFSAADFNNTSDTKARVGLVVGPEFEYTISDRFSIAAGLNYSQQGAELDKADVTFKLDYLTIPVVANVYLFKGFALKAGVQPGVNLSAKIDANGKKVDINDKAVKSFDVAIPLDCRMNSVTLCLTHVTPWVSPRFSTRMNPTRRVSISTSTARTSPSN